MAEKLGGGNQALALLCNTIATALCCTSSSPSSRRSRAPHFNPVVSLAAALRGELDWRSTFAYVVVQIAGGCVGAVLAHLMFGLDLSPARLDRAHRARPWTGEFIATFGLIDHSRLRAVQDPRQSRPRSRSSSPPAYWFTASTSFANPAVTIARSLARTFAGIAPHDAPGFIAAELFGALAGAYLFGWLFAKR
jgi:glycerol uptake facilitator-like aquaporin